MIQLVVEEVFLDLYENDLPKITLQFDSFETFQPVSDYSQTFRVPATDNNYQFFKTAFEVNGYDFDVTTRKEAQILVDGNEFIGGELRLNKVYHGEGNKIDYEVLFLGNTRNFAGKLGSKLLNQLDLSELNHEQSMLNVTTSWLAYPTVKDRFNNDHTSDPTTGFKNGNVLYPLVDFGNNYDSNESTENVAISVGNDQHITQGDVLIVPFTSRIWADRFKPMVRARYLFDKIFEEAGFTYTSNFLIAETNPFQRLYVSAWGNDDDIFCLVGSNTFKSSRTEDLIFSSNESIIVNFDSEVNDFGDNYDTSTGIYTAAETGIHQFKVKLLGSKSDEGSVYCDILVNGSPAESSLEEFEDEQILYVKNNFQLYLSAGDEVSIRVRSNSGVITANIFPAEFSCILAPGTINIPALLEDKYKQIDFIKDILTTFKLVMVPDRSIPNNFLIETWGNFIGKGDVYDWTSKLDLSKDVQIEPLFNEQKQRILFKTKDEGDWLNDLNKKTFKEDFGDLEVNSNNDLLVGDKEIKTTYASTPVTEIQGASTNTGIGALVGRDNMVIPHIYSLEAGETRALRKPIKPKTRFLFYNGMKYTGRTFDGLNTSTDKSAPWYWRTDDPTVGAFSELFPQVTPYQYTFNPNDVGYITDQASLNLNWQFENGYLRLGTLSPGYSVYDQYWNEYTSLLYNKYSRRLIANFVLSNQDLVNFNFDDVIFVKDAYFYVEKIENVPLGEKASVKVSLIKLIDYNPDQGGFVPPFQGLVWEDVNTNWEAISDDWGAF